ncbi:MULTISPECIES: hypothetical protein [Megasphaera]|jgi:hypothetical protein|nr:MULTISPECIES: hypothetical protein [Megasphaera]
MKAAAGRGKSILLQAAEVWYNETHLMPQEAAELVALKEKEHI